MIRAGLAIGVLLPPLAAQFNGREFRTVANFGKEKPYAIPCRCLYSRNIGNLFMAAAIARRRHASQRDVHAKYLNELRAALTRGAGKR